MPEFNTFFGLNIRDEKYVSGKDSQIRFLESSDIKNIKLEPNGGSSMVGGRDPLNAVELTALIKSIDWFVDKNGNEHLLFNSGINVYDASGLGDTPVVSKAGITADALGNNVSFMGFLWYCDGNENLKFDGTDWSSWGIVKPVAAPTLVAGAAGLLDGTYEYVYNYVYDNASFSYESESAVSDFASISVVNKKIKISGVADPTGEATGIRVWRRSTVYTEFLLVKEYPTNANFIFTDNQSFSDIKANVSLSGAFEGAPAVSFNGVVSWKNRLWAWSGTTLYYTRERQPEKFWSIANGSDYLPYEIDTETGDEIVTCIPFGNELLIFTKSKCKAMAGDQEFNFVLYDKFPTIGCTAGRSATDCRKYLMWLADDGVWRFDGYTFPTMVSEKINTDREGGERGLLETHDAYRNLSAGIYDRKGKRYLLSTPVGGSPFNGRTFAYHFEMAKIKPPKGNEELSAWSLLDSGFADATNVSEKRICSADSTQGYYVLEDTGTTDIDGTDMTGFQELMRYDFEDLRHDKRFGFITVAAWTTGEPIKFKTLFVRGRGPELFEDEFTMSRDGATWGPDADGGTWGPDTAGTVWGGNNVSVENLDYPQESIGTFIGFRWEFDTDAYLESFEVTDITKEARDVA